MAYRKKQKWKQFVLLGTWLLFFPNALYIVTDLVHIDRESMVPWWFDAVLLFLASFIGIVLGFVSLRKAERYLLISPKKLFRFKLLYCYFLGLLVFTWAGLNDGTVGMWCTTHWACR